MVSTLINEEQRLFIKQSFVSYDKSGDNRISIHDLQPLCESLGVYFTED